MKKALRVLTFTLILLSLASTNNSKVEADQKPIDPACVEFCRQKLFDCISAAQTNGQEKKCISVYRSCIAGCK